ncbi:DUF2502 domain-containing protein [Pantoea tagorei]
MKFAVFAALLTCLSPLAIHNVQAAGASISLAPGVTLNLGDQDRRGYYWDGGRWREPRWWHDRYQYNNHRWWRHEEWRRHQQWERERRWHERERRHHWRDAQRHHDRHDRHDRHDHHHH